MHRIKKLLIGLAFVTVAAAQSSEPPLNDSRLTVHTSDYLETAGILH